MRARLVAPLVAAVLGIAGGVATALVTPDDGDGAGTRTFSDPLHLGIPLVDQGCSGDSVLIIGYGNSVAPLSSAVANSGKEGLRYLRGEESCPTMLGPKGKPTPAYVVYRGPYDNRQEPCELRMSGTESGSFVTELNAGNQDLVKCPCEIPTSDAPTLTLDMVQDQRTTLWVRGLQSMLNDDDPKAFPHSAITGKYDPFTSARVTTYQDAAPGKVTRRGEVDKATWDVLTNRLCRNYDY
jgi:hypothetical protein